MNLNFKTSALIVSVLILIIGDGINKYFWSEYIMLIFFVFFCVNFI